MDGCMDVWTDSERENSGRRRQGDVERERERERERGREKKTPSVHPFAMSSMNCNNSPVV